MRSQRVGHNWVTNTFMDSTTYQQCPCAFSPSVKPLPLISGDPQRCLHLCIHTFSWPGPFIKFRPGCLYEISAYGQGDALTHQAVRNVMCSKLRNLGGEGRMHVCVPYGPGLRVLVWVMRAEGVPVSGGGEEEQAFQRRWVPFIHIDIWALKWILVNILPRHQL